MNPITIAGIGNILMGDDSIGPHIARILEAEYDFEGARVADLGTPVLDFPDHLEGSETILIIDAVENRKVPGTITVYTKQDIVKNGVPVRTDPHSPALAEMMLRAEFTGIGPKEAVLVGVTAKQCNFYQGLSDEVRQAIPAAMEEVLRQAAKLGVSFRKKENPSAPAIWWDTPAEVAAD
ncbi:MAG TPA: hydrogenase maturation protease [Terriglobales bacterium]|nr:hydrogenase maturation protease [Terriglobales bacterium]